MKRLLVILVLFLFIRCTTTSNVTHEHANGILIRVIKQPKGHCK